jgi:hypothetical protein
MKRTRPVQDRAPTLSRYFRTSAALTFRACLPLRAHFRKQSGRHVSEHLRIDVRAHRRRELRLRVQVRGFSPFGGADPNFQVAPILGMLSVPDLAGSRVVRRAELEENTVEAPRLVFRRFRKLLVADVGNREQLALANGFNGTSSYGVRRRSIDLARLHSKDARVLNCVSSNSDAVRRREYGIPSGRRSTRLPKRSVRKLRRGDSPG